MSFADQLKSPHWQRRRLEILERDNFACANCGDTESTLHVHHRRYIKGRKVWEYGDDELDTLCEACHAEEHRAVDMMQALHVEPDFQVKAAYAFLVGFMAGNCSIGVEESSQAKSMDGFHYDLGVMASMASGARWCDMAKAARIMNRGHVFTPEQEQVLTRWEASPDA